MPIRGKGWQIDEGDLQDHLPVWHEGDSRFLQKFIFYDDNEGAFENDDEGSCGRKFSILDFTNLMIQLTIARIYENL